MADLGQDLSCVSDVTPDFREVSGRRAYAEAIARRYQTPRGTLLGDPNYGFDLTQYVNDDIGPGDVPSIEAGAEAEALKDERTLSAAVSVELDAAGGLTVTCALQDGQGPFTLVLDVSNVTVTILDLK